MGTYARLSVNVLKVLGMVIDKYAIAVGHGLGERQVFDWRLCARVRSGRIAK